MKKKLIALLLAMTVAVASLAGCSNNVGDGKTTQGATEGKTDGATEDGEATTEAAPSNFNEEGYPIVNEEITLKIMLCINDGYNMVAPEEMPAIKRMEELTGIKTEWDVVKAADWSIKLTTTFASEEYPDVIISNFSAVDYEEYGVDQEILIPLDNLIDKYLPSYKERIAMEDYNPVANLIASDGKTYSVGYMNNAEYMLSKYYINTDWLKALNMEAPTTIEGLTDVLRAFKNQDFNGNGEKDEIPLITSFEGYTNNVSTYLPLFGVPFNLDNYLTINDDKKVEFLPYMDGFRECMEWMHQLYDEELLDIEVLSQDHATVTQKFKDGLGGFASFYFPLSEFVSEHWDDVSLWEPSEGTKMNWVSTYAKPGTFLTVANEYPEATMRWIEAMLDKEVMYSLYIGEKDGTGNTTYWDYNEKGLIERYPVEGAVAPEQKTVLNTYGIFFAPGEYYKTSFAQSENATMIFEADDVYRGLDVAKKYSDSMFKIAQLSSDEEEQRALIETEIKTAMKEHMAIFIKEGVTDTNWKTFIDVLKNIGCDKYVAMYQAAIDKLHID